MAIECNKKPPQAILRGPVKHRESGQTIVDLFDKHVIESPNSIAVKDKERELSYEQLSFFVTKIARYVDEVPKVNKRVAILIQNSVESVSAVMGVLKARSAYVPLDIKGGPYRNESILLDSQPDLILISQKYLDKVKNDSEWKNVAKLLTETFSYEVIEELMNANQDENDTVLEKVKCEDYAYIIYTSGSTGKPKGVVVSHYNLLNFIVWAKDQYVTSLQFEKPVMFALYASLAFDMTVISVLVPLISGNGIVTYDSSNSGYALSKIIMDNLVDILILTPSHLRIIEELNVSKSNIKVIVTGGETLKTSVARKICKLFSDRITFFNLYGPTETTIGCTSHKYDIEKDTNSTVPIGIPTDNVDIYLLKEDMTPARLDEIGEIYIAGVNVTDGYINKRELTDQCFMKNIYGEKTGKMYKSNDLAVLQADGEITFIGRNDHQIKFNGYRIELEEIESFLVQHESIKNAAVILMRESNLDFICAYMVTDKDCSVEDVKNHLITKLPLYMLPQKYVFLSALPYTVNGKIDRKKLSSTNSDIG